MRELNEGHAMAAGMTATSDDGVGNARSLVVWGRSMFRAPPLIVLGLLVSCATPQAQTPAAGDPASPETAVAPLASTAGALVATTTAAMGASPAADHSAHQHHRGAR